MTAALHTLLEHAENARDEALNAMRQAQDHLRRQQHQEEQLLAYRDDYRQRHPALGGRSTSIELLRCHEGFMQRLDLALQQQRGQVQHAEHRGEQLRAALVVQETRVASVRKLLERRGAQVQHQADRLEQRRSDETAMHQHRRRAEEAGNVGWRLGTDTIPLR